jgi:hypothetical protein
MPDALVVCFTPNVQSLEGSATVAQRVFLQRSGRPLEIFPVPMRVEYGEKELLERARMMARDKFDSIGSIRDPAYWGRVEFPYVPFYVYNEMLAVFADTPFSHASVLSAAENLTAYLTQGAVTRAGEMPDHLKQLVKARYTAGLLV